jgi:hypothetical protein
MDAEQVCDRFERLEAERAGTVEGLWTLIERYVLPFRGDFYDTGTSSESQVEWHRRGIYDSTAAFAAQTLAASLQGNLTSPTTSWFGLRFRDHELADNKNAQEWLEAVTQLVHQSLQESDFGVQIAEAYLDLVGFGTAVLVEEAETEVPWTGLDFTCVPLKEAYFEDTAQGQVYRLYRLVEWTPVQMIDKFGEDNVPSLVLERADNPAAAMEPMEVIWCVWPRDNIDADAIVPPVAPVQRPYAARYLLREAKEWVGEESGYYEMPAFVARWRTTSGSRWGHGPAAVAMGDILTLNQLVEGTLGALAKTVDPPVLVEEAGLFGQLDIRPGGLSVVRNIEGIKAFDSGARFDAGNMKITELREMIRQAFYHDQLALKESPAMTATEVSVRYELLQRHLGPTLARLMSDFLNPLITRAVNMLGRAGQLPAPPREVSAAQAQYEIEYSGPLPMAQKADRVQATWNWLQQVASIAQLFPQALQLVDIDGAINVLADMAGVPPEAKADMARVLRQRQAQAEQQQKMGALAALEAGGNAAGAMGEGLSKLREGSGNDQQFNDLVGGLVGGPGGGSAPPAAPPGAPVPGSV